MNEVAHFFSRIALRFRSLPSASSYADMHLSPSSYLLRVVSVVLWPPHWLTGSLAAWLTGGLAGWRPGWMAAWLHGWMAAWLDGWMAGWLDGWMAGWLDGCMAGWLDGWMAGWLHGWMARWLVSLLVGRQAGRQAGWLAVVPPVCRLCPPYWQTGLQDGLLAGWLAARLGVTQQAASGDASVATKLVTLTMMQFLAPDWIGCMSVFGMARVTF